MNDLSEGRRHFVKTAALTAGTLMVAPLFSCDSRPEIEYDYADLHVHEAERFTIKDIMKISEERKVKFGILEHPGEYFRIKNDTDLEAYIKRLREYPVYIGLQPVFRNWSKDFSKELLSQVDYILMDPQTIPNEDGSFMYIWQFDTRVDDTPAFMKKYIEHTIGILENEPIDIFGWPLFLPVCIARDYYTLWTDERLQIIIDLAKERNIAIEINEIAHVPHEAFLREAKAQGLKFTFGSDARDPRAGAMVYGRKVAESCGLTKADFFEPQRKA